MFAIFLKNLSDKTKLEHFWYPTKWIILLKTTNVAVMGELGRYPIIATLLRRSYGRTW